MTSPHLHIICLNVPYPVDYGGVFDLFYKLPALQQQGVKIHLHCFDYGRGPQVELNKYCEEVHYYKRTTGLKALSFNLPYIVSSRRNNELLNRLLKDDYPILMEGIHCTFLLTDKRFKGRKCFVRLHNVEHLYYKHLYTSASFNFKKFYYWFEARLLCTYEKALANKAMFWAVSKSDTSVYKRLGSINIHFLPLFLPPWKVVPIAGNGSYCLYQGDLSVYENQKSVRWLLEKVFNDLDIPLVIAGKQPSDQLSKMVHEHQNSCLVADPTQEEMQDMIAKAHIHVIPSFNATGIKLKLVNALFNGRHCIVNEATVSGTGLETLCYIAKDAASFKSLIQRLFKQPLNNDQIEKREHVLSEMFNNETNAKQIVTWIWGK